MTHQDSYTNINYNRNIYKQFKKIAQPKSGKKKLFSVYMDETISKNLAHFVKEYASQIYPLSLNSFINLLLEDQLVELKEIETKNIQNALKRN